jgi:hypothetical protein
VHTSPSGSTYGYLNSSSGSRPKIHSPFDIAAAATSCTRVSATATATANYKNIKSG